jgi:hypothetical protein
MAWYLVKHRDINFTFTSVYLSSQLIKSGNEHICYSWDTQLMSAGHQLFWFSKVPANEFQGHSLK